MSLRHLALCSVAALALSAVGTMAADLPGRAAAAAPVYVAPIFTWTGFYVGLSAGYAGDAFEYPFSGDIAYGDRRVPYSGAASVNSSGFLGGAQMGYNWQFGNGFVAGVEADYSWANVEGRVGLGAGIDGFGGSLNAGSELTSLGTVRARLGYGWDRALFYVTGGWAWGRVESTLDAGFNDSVDRFGLERDVNKSGWTLGAGMEFAFTNNMSFKTEYLYVDLGDKNLYSRDYTFGGRSVATARLDVETKVHVVRAGLNYRFWTPVAAGPVLARY
jgi:outer membrane immunogenic protein